MCARLEIFKPLMSIPSFSRLSNSPNITSGLITTPLPITAPFLAAKIPDGIRRILKVLSPISIVWPALLPPFERTAIAASLLKKSVILPFPSSPH